MAEVIKVMKGFYLNLSIKYKILILFCIVIIIIASLLGLYSLTISKRNIINKVSSSNMSVNRQLNNSINFVLNDITDISTNICIDDSVQSLLAQDMNHQDSLPDTSLSANNSLRFIVNIIASKSYISFMILYGQQDNPIYYDFTDMSIGVKGLREVQKSELYQTALSLNGSPISVPLLESNNLFIQRSTFPKIGICRTVKNYANNNTVGFLVIGFNGSTLQQLCQSNIQNSDEGIMIVDGQGQILSHAGADIFASGYEKQNFYLDARKNGEGYSIDTIGKTKYLVTYATLANGWKSFYAVPMASLVKEINSINSFTLIVVIACLVVFIPLMAFMSSYLTAPIMTLLKSMKRFQQGNFNERVDFKYKDEIGQLGDGYNNMVKNIKELIDRAYVLQIKEREAELNALQAQINPHFLYNTLDAIFWKAEMRKETEISEMVYSLSRLFRLSLNRGESLTSILNEKEMLTHYLLLQKIRLKRKLNYKIEIADDISNYVIPKLVLQPFVENAILHGLDGKEEGGTILVNGERIGERLRFTIEDDGIGMSPEDVKQLLEPNKTEIAPGNAGSSGFAVNNVNERLKILYKGLYSLEISSEKNKGTKVTILIPLAPATAGQEVEND
jgi:two-component system, sensor histidine kinase YesM